MEKQYVYIARIIDHNNEFWEGYYKLGKTKHYTIRETQLNSTNLPIDIMLERVFEVEDMIKYGGAGASTTDATDDTGVENMYVSGTNYDVFPILVVGDDSFSTIGFQTDGKTVKFTVMTKMPGKETADRMTDPYGETGFSSMKWYYGFLAKRPERIALIKTVAPV